MGPGEQDAQRDGCCERERGGQEPSTSGVDRGLDDEAGRPQGSYMVLQWLDGEIETVLPEDSTAKTADAVFPKPEW